MEVNRSKRNSWKLWQLHEKTTLWTERVRVSPPASPHLRLPPPPLQASGSHSELFTETTLFTRGTIPFFCWSSPSQCLCDIFPFSLCFFYIAIFLFFSSSYPISVFPLSFCPFICSYIHTWLFFLQINTDIDSLFFVLCIDLVYWCSVGETVVSIGCDYWSRHRFTTIRVLNPSDILLVTIVWLQVELHLLLNER